MLFPNPGIIIHNPLSFLFSSTFRTCLRISVDSAHGIDAGSYSRITLFHTGSTLMMKKSRWGCFLGGGVERVMKNCRSQTERLFLFIGNLEHKSSCQSPVQSEKGYDNRRIKKKRTVFVFFWWFLFLFPFYKQLHIFYFAILKLVWKIINYDNNWYFNITCLVF